MKYEELINKLENDPNIRPMYCKKCNTTYKYGKTGKKCPICSVTLSDFNESVPKCPTCGSINIQSVSQTRRSLNRWAFGINNPTARAQFECQNCGYKW